MALATTCPQCRTSFKASAEQLKLRQGLVRCGICRHVFFGIDHLRYLDSPGELRQMTSASRLTAQEPDRRPHPADREPVTLAATDEADRALQPTQATFGPHLQTPAEDALGPRLPVTDADDREAPGYAAFTAQARHADDASLVHGSPSEMTAPSRWDDEAEDFGLSRDDASSGAGRLRILTVLALLVLAVLQLTLIFRGEVASAIPVLRPVVGTMANAFGMDIDPVRSLASLSIESSELRPGGSANRLSFDAVLRNSDRHAVRWPAMELTLKDAVGAVLVRKVIMPADYLGGNALRRGLGPRSELPVRVELDSGGLQTTGYSVTLYYP